VDDVKHVLALHGHKVRVSDAGAQLQHVLEIGLGKVKGTAGHLASEGPS
jgi:hypothetical protein